MNDGGLRLARAQRRIEILEKLLDDRSRELAIIEEQASAVQSFLVKINDVIPGALISVTPQGVITRINRGVLNLLGYGADDLFGKPLTRLWPSAGEGLEAYLRADTHIIRDEAEWLSRDGKLIPVHLSAALQHDGEGSVMSIVFVGLDLRERRQLEIELRHAHKLEALGQLAAGIAHEINTPMQFIGDNLSFIQESFNGIMQFVDAVNELNADLQAADQPLLASKLEKAMSQADLDYVRKRLPRAIERAIEGVSRASRIVEAMKAFSHPQTEMGLVNLNEHITNTLVVAHNEYKYVADLETELGELPNVVCNGGDLNQVVLNLIVNAAHAIESRFKGSGGRGLIKVRTWRDADEVVIAVVDNGCGIPEGIRDRVFDPFFTTKPVGKGTGQGLSIAHSIVVDRHGGNLFFDSELDVGTTFYVRLPIRGPDKNAARSALSASQPEQQVSPALNLNRCM